MKNYSIDTNARIKIYSSIAIISVAASSLLTLFEDNSFYKFIAPSVLMIYFILFNFFDKYLWKMKFLSSIPNLNGKWEGEITNSDNLSSPLSLRIKQTWTKIDVVFESKDTISKIIAANIDIENSNETTLKYIYLVRGKTVEKKDVYGEGSQEFRLSNDNKSMEGTYYSSKYRGGKANVKFIE